MIGFKAIEFYIPECLYPTKNLKEVSNLSPMDDELFRLLQIDSIPIAGNMSSIDLSYEAAIKALRVANLAPEEIDIVITLQSRVPDYFMSSEVTRIQEMLKLTNAFGISITDLGCANINGALIIAKDLLRANPNYKNILICFGSKPYSEKRYRNGVTITGDAGMGIIVSSQLNINKIIDINMKTDGRFWDLYKVKYKDKMENDYEELCENSRLKFELSTISSRVFSELNSELLKKNNISKIDGYIIQNLSIPALKFNEKSLKISFADSCYRNCKQFGHLGSIDTLLNYKTSVLMGEFNKGDRILVLNNSPVACWSSMIIEV